MQRPYFKVLSVDAAIKNGDSEYPYQTGTCWDGSHFDGERIIFHFVCRPDEIHAGDVISGVPNVAQPQLIQDIALEQSAKDIVAMFAPPEPFQFPPEPAPQPKMELTADLEMAVRGNYLAPADLLELGRRFLALEKFVKERVQ